MARPPLDRNVSLYLDVARIGAAAVVVLHHVFNSALFEGAPPIPGHSAVTVFFVISGFVIAYATDGQTDWRSYATARFARIYSVALPALALTGLLYAAGQWAWTPTQTPQFDRPLLRLLLSGVFVNQLWNLTVAPLNNGPYWSLCFEVWYYAMFGAAVFMRGTGRWLAIGALAILVGPRALLLLPTWLLGVWLYRHMKALTPELGAGETACFRLFLLALLVSLAGANPAAILSQGVRSLLDHDYLHVGPVAIFVGAEAVFPNDYADALLFAGTIRYSRAAFPQRFQESRGSGAIRLCAAHTFSLYLYHAPILYFVMPLARRMSPGFLPALLVTALIVGLTVVLARHTEQRRQPYTALARRILGGRPAR